MKFEELPKLKGTPKQVEWANTIRYRAAIDYGDRAWVVISSIRSAALWIANRDNLLGLLGIEDDDSPQRLSDDELADLDLTLYTKTELLEMWMVDRAIYMQDNEFMKGLIDSGREPLVFDAELFS